MESLRLCELDREVKAGGTGRFVSVLAHSLSLLLLIPGLQELTIEIPGPGVPDLRIRKKLEIIRLAPAPPARKSVPAPKQKLAVSKPRVPEAAPTPTSKVTGAKIQIEYDATGELPAVAMRSGASLGLVPPQANWATHQFELPSGALKPNPSRTIPLRNFFRAGISNPDYFPLAQSLLSNHTKESGTGVEFLFPLTFQNEIFVAAEQFCQKNRIEGQISGIRIVFDRLAPNGFRVVSVEANPILVTNDPPKADVDRKF